MMWGCMSWDGVGYAAKIDGRMDSDLYCSILEDELPDSIKYFKKKHKDILFQQDNDPKHTSKKATKISSFSKIMTSSTQVKKQHLGLKTTRFRSWTGQLNPQISILLSIFGFTLKDSLQHTQHPLVGLMNYGSIHIGSGKPLTLLWFRI